MASRDNEESDFMFRYMLGDNSLMVWDQDYMNNLPRGMTGFIPEKCSYRSDFWKPIGNEIARGTNNRIYHAFNSKVVDCNTCSIVFGVNNLIENSEKSIIWNGKNNVIRNCINARILNLDNFEMTKSNCLAKGSGGEVIYVYDT